MFARSQVPPRFVSPYFNLRLNMIPASPFQGQTIASSPALTGIIGTVITILEIERLASRRHGLAEVPLSAVSLEIRTGEVVTLSGPSGCGKTLLLRAIADLDPSTGTAVLDGKHRDEYSGPEWRRRVGFVATESAWWTARVGEHFMAPPVSDDFSALGFSAAVLAREVSGLSTGERQRLALLRCLGNRPRIMLLDEPSASLDHEMTLRLEVLVREYVESSNCGVLWVCHDLKQRRRIADRAFQVHGGVLHPVDKLEPQWALSH
jgi:ABC-type iron transport system FetAB ATPase subunit